ncbi:unnamed protein product [Urochloa decumbens]|uniref:Dof zinc finger protein n=1 Tax=Urochloa decumbens TaxID=240449 RepID=A0ABC8WAL7_9POAL
MEAPLHQLPLPLPPFPPAMQQEQDTAAVGAALLRQAAAARAIMMTAASQSHQQQPPAPAPAMAGREQCPRCASRDTKFCYYNNYNTAQPRHFCRACRRYWTLGGSLRNVPVGGSTRKRPRPARPTRAVAAAVAYAAAGGGPSPFAVATGSSSATVSTAPQPPPSSSSPAAGLLGTLLLGGCTASSSTTLMLALGAMPLLEGRLGSGGLGLGQPAPLQAGGGGAGDVATQLGFGGAGPMLWPATTTTVLEGDRAEDTAWKPAGGAFPLLPAAALWQELAAAAAPALEAGAGMLHHGGSAPHLLM